MARSEGDDILLDGQDPGEQQQAKHPKAAFAALAAVIAVILLLLLLDLWVARSPAQRAFVIRNVECLRCHPDKIPKPQQASVHQPFEAKHCTSCHKRHGYQKDTFWKQGDYGPFAWLQLRLEQLGLRVLWDLITAASPFQDEQKLPQGTVSSLETTSPGGLRVPQEQLCMECHGNMGPKFNVEFRHPPFANGQCTSCHDPHSSDTAPLLLADTKQLCPSCHRVGPDMLRSDVHQPFGQLRCVSCHDPHASSYRGMLVSSQRQLCFGCHGELGAQMQRSVRHQPFETGDCTGCHKPHSGDFASLLNGPQPELCYGCHGGVRREFARDVRHPVPSRLICTDCHEAHAADVSGLLPMAQRDLCLGCHDTVRQELTKRVIHKPLHSDCTGCHVPHGSSISSLLQAADPALCLRCHPGKEGTVDAAAHERQRTRRNRLLATLTTTPNARIPGIAAQAANARSAEEAAELPRPGPPEADPIVTAYDPVPSSAGGSHPTPDGCLMCHEEHAADEPRLLVASGNTLCLRCHSASVPAFADSSHKGLECLRCHSVHTSASAPLLRSQNPGLCLQCHTQGFAPEQNAHPVGPSYYDFLNDSQLTCTSTCHNPHGTTNPRMLRVPFGTEGKGEDFVCLICHTSVGIQY